jgi:tripartite-type tricarboxylate transporter receptor subunit TctC
MSPSRRRFLLLAAVAAALPALARVALAEPFQSRSIMMIVPATVGGPTDALGRIVGERMARALGQCVLYENMGIAGGASPSAEARAAPDGYTLSIGHWTTHVANGAV